MAQTALAPAEDPQAAAEKQKAADARCARRWIAELTLSEKAQAKWLTKARKIVKRYRYEDSDSATRPRQFAMLWSNTQTIQPAVYSRPPQAVVSRRFKDADPVGRQASEVLERAITYSIDKQDLDGRLRQCSFDYVLLARGQTWERYVPTHGPTTTRQIELQVVTSGDEGSDDWTETYRDPDGADYEGDVTKGDDGNAYGQSAPYEPVIFEESITDYVNWQDFGHSVARTWDEVDYVWRRVYLSRAQLIDRFGEELGKRVPLDWGPKEKSTGTEDAELTKKAAVYEIWCKSEKKTYWVSKSFGERPLDTVDDMLGLDGFFPCPRPLLGTTGNDSAIPTPDYVFYQDQAKEIDKLTARIAVLQDAVKVRGFYAGEKKNDLNNLLNSDTNMLVPVPDWATMKEGGGIRGNIDWFPIEQVVSALNALIAQRQQLIEDVYQITGVSDIQRGESDPRETMGAQQIKSTWGSMRVRDRQIEMMRFARDVLRIKGEVIAGKFSIDTLRAMTGVQMPTNAEKQQIELKIQQVQMLAQAQPSPQVAAMAQQAPAGPPQAPGPPGQPPMAVQPPQSAPTLPQPPPQPSPMMVHNGGPPMGPQIPPEVQELLDGPSWEDVEALLTNNATRQFRVDIETDSTIEPNESEEKQRATELLTALSAMIATWGPAIAAQPALAPLAGAIIKFAVRKYRAGRELEDIIDQTIDKLLAQAANAPPPGAPPVDQTPIQVEVIKQQTAAQNNAAETERTQIMAGVKEAEVQVKSEANHLKLVEMAQPQAQAQGLV